MKTSLTTLRLPEELRIKIRKEATQNEMSINQYILYTLTKEIAYREAERDLKARIKNALPGAEALKLLDAIVPDVPPVAGDSIPLEHH